MRVIRTLLLVIAVGVMRGHLVAEDTCSGGGTIEEVKLEPATTVMRKAGQLNTLLKALETTGLMELLEGKGPITLFAPTDDAFAKLPKGSSVLTDKERLRTLLLYHMVEGQCLSTHLRRLKSGSLLNTLLKGKRLTVTQREGHLFVNGAKVVRPNLLANNAVIHVIDKVLLPPSP